MNIFLSCSPRRPLQNKKKIIEIGLVDREIIAKYDIFGIYPDSGSRNLGTVVPLYSHPLYNHNLYIVNKIFVPKLFIKKITSLQAQMGYNHYHTKYVCPVLIFWPLYSHIKYFLPANIFTFYQFLQFFQQIYLPNHQFINC